MRRPERRHELRPDPASSGLDLLDLLPTGSLCHALVGGVWDLSMSDVQEQEARVDAMGVLTDSPTAATVTADTNDRRTPRWFFEQCEARFGAFSLDAAATNDNRLCKRWFGPDSPYGSDGLSEDWDFIQVWLNPPYGPPGTIERWIAKAKVERDKRGCRVLMLLPADTSTKWYHDVARTELIELVPFRLAFEAPDGSTKGNSAKFGSVLVWIAPKIHRPKKA